jgi:hypothetical protein
MKSFWRVYLLACLTALADPRFRRTFWCALSFAGMEISKKLKIALDETRMEVLGVQILIGFQFRSVFQNSFDTLPAWSQLSGRDRDTAYGLHSWIIIITGAVPSHRRRRQ